MPPTTLVFECGVMRFDASANLFVHLTHSSDAPQPIVIGKGPPGKAPAKDRRARLVGQSSGSKVVGAWPKFTSSLPRGIVVEVRSYKEVRLEPDGALTVTLEDPGEIPSWFEAGKVHTFERDGESLRMWDKSSRPELEATDKKKGKKAATKKAASAVKKPAAKKAAPAAKKPAAKKPTASEPVAAKRPQPTPENQQPPRPAPSPAAGTEREPYRPGRMPAGSYTAGRRPQEGARGSLGCLGLLVLVSLAISGLATLL